MLVTSTTQSSIKHYTQNWKNWICNLTPNDACLSRRCVYGFMNKRPIYQAVVLSMPIEDNSSISHFNVILGTITHLHTKISFYLFKQRNNFIQITQQNWETMIGLLHHNIPAHSDQGWLVFPINLPARLLLRYILWLESITRLQWKLL